MFFSCQFNKRFTEFTFSHFDTIWLAGYLSDFSFVIAYASSWNIEYPLKTSSILPNCFSTTAKAAATATTSHSDTIIAFFTIDFQAARDCCNLRSNWLVRLKPAQKINDSDMNGYFKIPMTKLYATENMSNAWFSIVIKAIIELVAIGKRPQMHTTKCNQCA